MVLGIKPGGGGEPITIAIGQPFGDYLTPEQEARIRARIAGLPYFPHPREMNAPAGAIRDSLILEDYVAELSQTRDVTLIGAFSTALITIPGIRKVYLDADGDPRRREVMEASGCLVENLI